jgi:hypothetical protein
MTAQLQSHLGIFLVDGDKLTDQKAGKLVNDVDAIKWMRENGKENSQYAVIRVYTKTSF